MRPPREDSPVRAMRMKYGSRGRVQVTTRQENGTVMRRVFLRGVLQQKLTRTLGRGPSQALELPPVEALPSEPSAEPAERRSLIPRLLGAARRGVAGLLAPGNLRASLMGYSDGVASTSTSRVLESRRARACI